MTSTASQDEGLLTVDELAAAAGLTVRTTRYYASLGLLPPPERRGRMAYYGPPHKARLDLVIAMQQHGYTLAAIEKHLAAIQDNASADEIALQGSLLLAWTPAQLDEVDRATLESRAGRVLSEEEMDWLERSRTIRPSGDGTWLAVPFLDISLELLATGFPVETLVKSNQAVRRHMDALVEELHELLTADVVSELVAAAEDTPEARQLERTLTILRRLSQEAVALGYQRAQRHLLRRQVESTTEEATS